MDSKTHFSIDALHFECSHPVVFYYLNNYKIPVKTQHIISNFNILFIVHPNILTVFFTNLMHKFFILIHLLHSSTCFEHYYAHPQEVKLY